ncbi:MAG: phosphoribosylglycinamide formyltransferase [Clostridia bacterium]|nr:phosphoribosylglycinamide formyltransferase [Clostridia bacterium]
MNTNTKKIAVLVSGGGTNLQALIDAEERGELGNGKITLVIASKPGVYALERAKNHGIASKVLARREYDSIAAYSKALADALEAAEIDLVVLAGFLTIIDEQVYERFPNRILNVHPALIPSFCGKGFYGLHVHEAALEKGVRVSGATVHIVTPECDAGPIVLQKAVEVKQDDTPEILQKRIMEEAEWKILPEAVKLFCEDRITVKENKVYIKGEQA